MTFKKICVYALKLIADDTNKTKHRNQNVIYSSTSVRGVQSKAIEIRFKLFVWNFNIKKWKYNYNYLHVWLDQKSEMSTRPYTSGQMTAGQQF